MTRTLAIAVLSILGVANANGEQLSGRTNGSLVIAQPASMTDSLTTPIREAESHKTCIQVCSDIEDSANALVIQSTPVPEPAAAGVLMFAGGALTLARPNRGTGKGGLSDR